MTVTNAPEGTNPLEGIAALPADMVFKTGAMPELFIPDAWGDDDDRYYVPLGPGVGSKPIWISPSKNAWVDILRAENAGLLQRHYHPHDVFGLCISGSWRYLEHDWVAKPGSFIYESPGESHTLVVEESGEVMRTMFHVNGPLIWLDDNGDPMGIHDAFSLIEMTKAHYEAVGIGADYVDTLIR